MCLGRLVGCMDFDVLRVFLFRGSLGLVYGLSLSLSLGLGLGLGLVWGSENG